MTKRTLHGIAMSAESAAYALYDALVKFRVAASADPRGLDAVSDQRLSLICHALADAGEIMAAHADRTRGEG